MNRDTEKRSKETQRVDSSKQYKWEVIKKPDVRAYVYTMFFFLCISVLFSNKNI